MIQIPHENLKSLRKDVVTYKGKIPQGISTLPKFFPKENVYEMEITLSTDIPNIYGINLCVGEERKIILSYDTQSKTLLGNRTNCSDIGINKFPRISFAKVSPIDKKIKLHFFVDKLSIELFTNDGKEVFTLQIYAADKQTGIEVFALNKGTAITFDACNLKSIWNNQLY